VQVKNMTTILTIIHIAVCLFLVSIVLLQHGKGADIGATFGGSSQSLFGTEGPVPLMNKVTTAAAVIFMMTSISLAYFSANQGTGSVMSDYQAPAPPPAQTMEIDTQRASSDVVEPAAEPGPANAIQEMAPAEFPGEESTGTPNTEGTTPTPQ
jgi:preprotein translocase subunit SecG